VSAENAYKLRVPDDIVLLLRKLHPEIKKHIRHALELIIDDPHCGKALKDDLEGIRSFRIKRYRIIYRFVNKSKQIEIIAVGPRKNIYKETFRIISKE
jgi:mRNA interferase RelE/StbE